MRRSLHPQLSSGVSKDSLPWLGRKTRAGPCGFSPSRIVHPAIECEKEFSKQNENGSMTFPEGLAPSTRFS